MCIRDRYIYDCSAPPGSELDSVDINPNGDAFLGVDPDFAVVGEKVFFAAIGAPAKPNYISTIVAPL